MSECAYNFMAIIIKNLLQILKEEGNQNALENYIAADNRERRTIECKLRKELPELYESKNIKEIFNDYQFKEKIGSFIRINKDAYVFIALLRKLDVYLSDERIFNFDNYKYIRGLNSNIKETRIVILPRCECFWERGHRGEQYGVKLVHMMKYFYYFEVNNEGVLLGYKGICFEIKNYLVHENFFYGSVRKSRLVLGISPLLKDSCLTKPKSYKVGIAKKFSVRLKKTKINILKKRIEAVLDKTKEEEVDILVFPEMLGSEEINDCIKKKLESNDDEKEYPSLIVAPSVWEGNHNTVSIFLSSGEVIGKQEKQNPFMKEKEVKTEKEVLIEDIDPTREILLFHCHGIGRIAVAICKDMLTDDYRRILIEELKVTLLIVPSYSSGFYDFSLTLEECVRNDIVSIWINSCSALEDGKKCIGMVRGAGKVSGSKSFYEQCEEVRCRNDCFFKCELELVRREESNLE